ncbi:uncharacterized protein BXZ73DRAFT_59528, partial [Epithele typhae]|uniref:uncharacterized protein n=1 Tax=Epithele typhae TaxID=378194 RepID=UPI002008E628
EYGQSASGGMVVRQVTSLSPALSLWQSPSRHDPNLVLDGTSSIWSPASLPAQLGVRTSRMIRVSHVVIQPSANRHEMAGAETRSCAPRNIKLWGIVDGKHNRERFELLHTLAHPLPRPSIHRNYLWALLGTFVYDVHNTAHSQRFYVLEEIANSDMTFGIFALEIIDNWGVRPSHTCLQSFAIYGAPETIE